MTTASLGLKIKEQGIGRTDIVVVAASNDNTAANEDAGLKGQVTVSVHTRSATVPTSSAKFDAADVAIG